MRMPMVRLFFVSLFLFALTGCLSHFFVDSTTRLQVENRTDAAIVGVDVVSEDGSSVQPWIDDTIPAGERSRVYEEDWVGNFYMRVRFDKKEEARVDVDFEGGSLYMVVMEGEDGNIQFKFR